MFSRRRILFLCFLVGSPVSYVMAGERAYVSTSKAVRGLQWADWGVIGIYGAFMIALGFYYSRRQTTTEDYFLGGRRTGAFVAGVSLFATLLSTISYLSIPGELIKHGPIFFLTSFGTILAIPIVGYVLIPAIMRTNVTSAYEILEVRLGVVARMAGSAIFIVTRLVWMALLTYISCKAVVVMMHWNPGSIYSAIWLLGAFAVAYTMLGGLRAVMITDVVQSGILLGGLVLTIVFITINLGGPSAWLPTEWAPHWDEQPLFSFSPTVRVTILGSLFYAIMFWGCSSVSDQITIQRYLSTRDIKTARRAFMVTAFMDVFTTIVLVLTGFALLGFFQHHSEFLPAGTSVPS